MLLYKVLCTAKLSSLVEVAVRPSATPSDPLRTSDLAFQRHQTRIASFRSSVLGYSWCYLFVAISGGWGPVGAVYFWAGWPVRRLCDALGFQQLVSFDHSGPRQSSLRCSGGTLPLLHKSCDSDDHDCSDGKLKPRKKRPFPGLVIARSTTFASPLWTGLMKLQLPR